MCRLFFPFSIFIYIACLCPTKICGGTSSEFMQLRCCAIGDYHRLAKLTGLSCCIQFLILCAGTMRGPPGSSLRDKLKRNCARVPKSLIKFDKFLLNGEYHLQFTPKFTPKYTQLLQCAKASRILFNIFSFNFCSILWICSPLKQHESNILVVVPDGGGIGGAPAKHQQHA